MNNFGKNLALWVIIGLLLMALVNLFQGSQPRSPQTTVAYSDFLADVEAQRVAEVTIQGDVVTGRYTDGRVFQTYAPRDPRLIDRLESRGVRIDVRPVDDNVPSLLSVLVSWFPMLLLIGVWIFFMRQMQSGGGRAMGFGKSRARLLTEKHGRVTFDDVAGIDEVKEEVQEIVEFLKNPQRYQQLGARIPKGVLLVGPPGTGKTLLARAIAGEANVPFFTISGSDFVEMFVGVGAARVRDMFEQAKKHAPCIVFIDEIDAVGRHRGAGLGGGNDEREQTLNQLLVEMDGFESNEGVILIAATNRPDVLDPALLRPGRFDRQIVVPFPDVAGREKILQVHMRRIRVAPDVDPKVLARGTPGFSGADLANIVNEAALLAARKGKRLVTMAEFEEAKDKVMMGIERRSMVMSEEERRLTAYHEAGHAVVAYFTPGSDPIHKATIVPRGRALGMVMRLPEGDRLSVSRMKLEADIAVAMGGRVAEELIFGREKVTAGAASDIQQATKIARHMVTEWGMSDELGPVGYAENTQEIFLGAQLTQIKNVSEDTARKIDREIRRIIEEGYRRARAILEEHRDRLHALAEALLEYETLTGEEIDRLMKGEPIVRPQEPQKPAGPGGAAATAEGRRTSVPPTTRPAEGPGGMAPQPGV